MNSASIFEILSQPLILIETEEVKVCLGHQEIGNEYSKRDKAKEAAFKWFNEKKKDPTIKECDFTIEDKHKKPKRPFYTYTHVNDIIDCNHYKIEVIRNILKLSTKEVLEKEPFEQL